MDRVGFSLRQLERRYGIARDRWSAAIRAGELPAARIGLRRFTVLERDAEGWLARYRVHPSLSAEAVVEPVIGCGDETRSAR